MAWFLLIVYAAYTIPLVALYILECFFILVDRKTFNSSFYTLFLYDAVVVR